MNHNPTLRSLYSFTAAFTFAIALNFNFTPLFAAEPSRPAPGQEGFRFEELNDKSLKLWEGDRSVFVYNHGLISKSGVPENRARSSYFHPVYGLDGEVLTDDFPADHTAHRGLYWAWPHVSVGDQEHDLWGLRGIRIEFQRWIRRSAGPDTALLGIENAWVVTNKKVMHEMVEVQVYPETEQGRIIDIALTWLPLNEPITLRGAEGKSYGGLSFRFAPRNKTIITVPDGQTTNDLVMTKLPWADFSADFKTNMLSGAAIFVHPSHPDYPPTWMTRHYGVLAVGWPGVKEQTFQPGEPFTCRYRIWIHRGAAGPKDVIKLYGPYQQLKFQYP